MTMINLEDEIRNDYAEWLFNIVCGTRYPQQISYRMLLEDLHSRVFRFSVSKDQNRAADGEGLRYRFSLVCNHTESIDEILDVLDGPCSVLEMMIALSMKCEEIMDNPDYGERTSQWFWGMVVNLGLGSMIDSRYDDEYVDEVIERFLKREYSPDGEGGLFTIRHCDCDLRDVEIWYQLCWYLDSIA